MRDWILALLFMIGLSLLFFTFVSAQKSCDVIGDGVEIVINGGVDGLYRTDEYIVLNVRNKQPEEVIGILFHELVHQQVETDKGDYCGEKN